MREFASYVQFKQGNKVITQALKDGALIKAIRQTQLNNIPNYLISRTYIGSGCVGHMAFRRLKLKMHNIKL